MPNAKNDIVQLLTTEEAASMLGLKAVTLQKWRTIGHAPNFIKIGRNVRYDLATLNAFLEAGRRSKSEFGEQNA
jgi:excisionase family DNA binding protein|tara:strand:- start:9002 stop:9223 length:222 start_codon:yes stop_codon:yes gene_type:complete